MSFDITPTLYMKIDANSLVSGSGEYYKTSESSLGFKTITTLDTRSDAEEPFSFESEEGGGSIGAGKYFSTDFEITSGGEDVGITITTAMKMEPRMFYEYGDVVVDLMTGGMTQSTPTAYSFDNLGAEDCSARYERENQ